LASKWRCLLASCLLAVSACAITGSAGWYAERVAQGEALDVPYVRQASRTGCGMAALASVMAYYQDPAHSQQVLLDRYPPASPEGYSLGELRDVAHAHDLIAFVVPGDKAFLRSQLSRGRPLIVPLHDHYVVVAGMDDERRKVIAMDPARGPVELDFDDFAASWQRTNHAVLLVGLASGLD
jgi:ABC-type bacteriocin/lantibiotic exporter with double-glycine peptidase domain